MTTSADAFPIVAPDKIKKLDIPVLLMSGGLNVGNYNSLIDKKLAKLLPNSLQIFIEDARHEMFLDNAVGSNKAVIDFLKR